MTRPTPCPPETPYVDRSCSQRPLELARPATRLAEDQCMRSAQGMGMRALRRLLGAPLLGYRLDVAPAQASTRTFLSAPRHCAWLRFIANHQPAGNAQSRGSDIFVAALLARLVFILRHITFIPMSIAMSSRKKIATSRPTSKPFCKQEAVALRFWQFLGTLEAASAKTQPTEEAPTTIIRPRRTRAPKKVRR